METVSLKDSALNFSRIGLGCMGFGGAWDDSPLAEKDVKKARAGVEQALESGYTLFDHADIYTRGKAEECFGRLFKESPGLRDRMVIQTKCGIRFPDDPTPGLPTRYDFSAEHILAAVDRSLLRLNTDFLDILLLHRPDALVEPEEVAAAFQSLKDSGKVLYFGVSNHHWAQMDLLAGVLPVPLKVNQVQISLLDPKFLSAGTRYNTSAGSHQVDGTLEYCRRHGIQIQAWSPLAKGYLSGRAHSDASKRPLLDELDRLANEKQVSVDAVSLAWLLRHPAGIVPIIGTTDPQRIQRAAQSRSDLLSRDEWYKLLALSEGAGVP